MTKITIEPYSPNQRQALLDLSLRAWDPVFQKLRPDVDEFVFDNFYPEGWKARQILDIGTFLDENGERTVIVQFDGTLAAYAGIALHPEDNMGEIVVIAVDPAFQRNGIAQFLIAHCEDLIRKQGMAMVMIETGDDSGHKPAREPYEAQGYSRWPVARYFKEL